MRSYGDEALHCGWGGVKTCDCRGEHHVGAACCVLVGVLRLILPVQTRGHGCVLGLLPRRACAGSRACQKRDWGHHKHECGNPVLHQLLRCGETSPDAVLLKRVLRTRMREEKEAKKQQQHGDNAAAKTPSAVDETKHDGDSESHPLRPVFDDVTSMAHNSHLAEKVEPAQHAARKNLVTTVCSRGFVSRSEMGSLSQDDLLHMLTAYACVMDVVLSTTTAAHFGTCCGVVLQLPVQQLCHHQ